MANDYISREALFEDIKNAVRFTERTREHSAEMRGANKIIDRIRNAPAADVVERPRWISVKERLPDMKDGDWVLGVVNGRSENVRYEDAIVMVYYDSDDGDWFLEDDPEASITVTHWMPLPELPKEET